jgi:ABC-type multidrug transport system ATPase subunit
VAGIITGGFWAIMVCLLQAWAHNQGPSGSGKTTLMNALSYRLDRMVRQDGEKKLNGHDYNKRQLKEVSGYVMQDDQLNAHLTVGETMWYVRECSSLIGQVYR